MMLGLLQTEELDGLLLRIPGLLQHAETGIEALEQRAGKWLELLEAALSNNRMPLASKVAITRATLQIAGRPFRSKPRPTRRDRAAACIHALEQVVGEVYAELSTTHSRINEADAWCRRVVAIAHQKGLIGSVDQSNELRLHLLMDLMRADPDIAAGVVQMDSLVGPRDGLIILG
ncbi:hypothetical protein ACWF0M_12395 [Kribbella sp. NPDC055110]